ncbi:MAG: hypothetical protein ACR2K5_13415 [Pseudolabrys sp.]
MKLSTFAQIALTLVVAFILPAYADDTAIKISMVALIAAPQKLDGKLISTAGFLRLEFEGDSIYFNREDSKNRIEKNGLWITTNEEINARRNELNDKYVLIEGVFDAHNHGHMGLWSGAITDIRRLVPYQ